MNDSDKSNIVIVNNKLYWVILNERCLKSYRKIPNSKWYRIRMKHDNKYSNHRWNTVVWIFIVYKKEFNDYVTAEHFNVFPKNIYIPNLG